MPNATFEDRVRRVVSAAGAALVLRSDHDAVLPGDWATWLSEAPADVPAGYLLLVVAASSKDGSALSTALDALNKDRFVIGVPYDMVAIIESASLPANPGLVQTPKGMFAVFWPATPKLKVFDPNGMQAHPADEI